MEIKVGEVIKRNGYDLLVLDFIDEHPFVLTLNADLTCSFDNKTNNYNFSHIKNIINNWFNDIVKLKALYRKIDLLTLCGETYYNYGDRLVFAAPLTFDEWRKYAQLIKKYINFPFWLATAHSINSDCVCCVNYGGLASNYSYNYSSGSFGLAPAFILNEPRFTPNSIKDFSTEELLKEIAERVK